MSTMNISLTAKMRRFVDAQVKAGRYQTASEVVRDAIRLLQDSEARRAERLEDLRQEVSKGIDQIERGEGIRLKGKKELSGLFEGIKARGRQRLAAKQPVRMRKTG